MAKRILSQKQKKELTKNICDSITKRKRKTTKQFINNAYKIHNKKYNYCKTNYIKSCIKVEIICPNHGSFWMTPNNHLRGKGCIKCKSEKLSRERSMGKEIFVEKSKNIFGDKYDYNDVLYVNNRIKVKIKCKKHGYFFQRPGDHLKNHGCPICNLSKGELQICKFLNDNKINFISQKSFDDCRNIKTKRKLYFDFYILSKNILIEYDGEQHFKIGMTRNFKITNDILEYNQYKDKLKTEYAKEKNIKLIRIKYIDLNKVNDILEKELKS